jgi:hypothetical protein
MSACRCRRPRQLREGNLEGSSAPTTDLFQNAVVAIRFIREPKAQEIRRDYTMALASMARQALGRRWAAVPVKRRGPCQSASLP